MHRHGFLFFCRALTLLRPGLASLALVLMAFDAGAQDGRLKPSPLRTLSPQAEQLIAKMPAPQPTDEELRQPCQPNRMVPASSPHKELLEQHAVTLVGFELWGRKWLPSHASERCTDHGYLLAQFQRAQGLDKPVGVWLFNDVLRLRGWVLAPARDLVLAKALPLDLMLPVKGAVSEAQLALRADTGNNLPVDQPAIWVSALQGDAQNQCLVGQLYDRGEGVRQDPVMAAHWYKLAADQNDSCAQNNLGLLHRSGRGVGKDLVKAHQLFKLAAQQGLAVAQTNLGTSYKDGEGVARDPIEALAWFTRAAQQGHANGQYLLGRALQDTAPTEASKWFRKAAEQGHERAQRSLAIGYSMGWWGLPKDDALKVHWLRKAAEQGDLVAQDLLGDALSSGSGVAQDKVAAIGWYRKSASQGHASAMTSLGRAHLAGSGVAQDKRQAVSWLQRAATLGDAEGQLLLAAAHDQGDGVAQSHVEALRWWRAAADQGSGRAMLNIGRAHANGRGVPKDLAQARQWFERARSADPLTDADITVGAEATMALMTLKPDAAPPPKPSTRAQVAAHPASSPNQGSSDAEALYRLGVRHYQGNGVPQSEEKGAELHRQAAELGHPEAQFNFGWANLNGRGVPQNLALARKWLEASARQGVVGAQHTLARLHETGAGVPRDDAEAARWYRRAADQGDAASLASLGAMHAQGRGVPQNLTEARRLLGLAQAKGYQPASEMLRLLP